MEDQIDNPPVHTPSRQIVTLRDAITIIPEFNEKNIPLEQFIKCCSEAKIQSKIRGEARQSIFGQSFAKIKELQNFLNNIYSPAKSIPQLLGELGNEFQRDEESVIAFANRIMEIGIRIL